MLTPSFMFLLLLLLLSLTLSLFLMLLLLLLLLLLFLVDVPAAALTRHVQLGEEPDALANAPETHFGTATLRMHVAKHKEIKALVDGGQCASLVFAERSVDFGCDNASQRNMLAQGFRLLHETLSCTAAAPQPRP